MKRTDEGTIQPYEWAPVIRAVAVAMCGDLHLIAPVTPNALPAGRKSTFGLKDTGVGSDLLIIEFLDEDHGREEIRG